MIKLELLDFTRRINIEKNNLRFKFKGADSFIY